MSNATTECGRQEQEKVHVLGAKVAKELLGVLVDGKQNKAGREGALRRGKPLLARLLHSVSAVSDKLGCLRDQADSLNQ